MVIIAIFTGLVFIQRMQIKRLHAELDEIEQEISNPIIQRDTVTRVDTIYKDPIPKYVTKTNERVDTIIEYRTETDTLFIPLQLPIISKEYSDETYKALVKGVEFGSYPALESLEIYQPVTTISETKTIVRKPKFGFNLQGGVGVGYNPWSNKIEPMIGVTIGYGYRF